jgi:hypothetical protein
MGYNRKTKAGARSSAAEQAAHNRSVVGSNPTGPTFFKQIRQFSKHYNLTYLQRGLM